MEENAWIHDRGIWEQEIGCVRTQEYIAYQYTLNIYTSSPDCYKG